MLSYAVGCGPDGYRKATGCGSGFQGFGTLHKEGQRMLDDVTSEFRETWPLELRQLFASCCRRGPQAKALKKSDHRTFLAPGADGLLRRKLQNFNCTQNGH